MATSPAAADPASASVPGSAGATLLVPTAIPAGATPAPAPGAAALASATISVNGVPEAVGLKASFPAADPHFRLVALGADEIQISVVTAATPGTPTSGTNSPTDPGSAPAATPVVEQTVTLVRDRTLTLLDTASGARYELRLVTLP